MAADAVVDFEAADAVVDVEQALQETMAVPVQAAAAAAILAPNASTGRSEASGVK